MKNLGTNDKSDKKTCRGCGNCKCKRRKNESKNNASSNGSN